VDARIYSVFEGDDILTMPKSTGAQLMELPAVFDRLKPDIVITIADRYETIATAIAASYMNIPVAHIQGGEITGTIDERVRHAVTKLSDVHFVATAAARERVIKLGEDASRVFLTGCPSIDLAARVIADPGDDINPFEKYGGVGAKFNLENGYIVVMQHPVTTEHEQARAQVEETLHAIYDADLPALWFWPNVDAGSDLASGGIRAFRENNNLANVHFFKNIPPLDFLRLLYHSRGIVGNSSVAIRECSFLGVGAVNIGTRESGRECGTNVINVPHDRWQILNAIQTHLMNQRYAPSHLYGDGNAGERIAELLATAELTNEKRLAF
jgi:UDP-hydrolysing UDP-N-acetyl-D-glucosamine 2-epimerase